MWRYYYTIVRNIFRLPEAIIINEVAKEVQEGRKCILSPEGTYDNKKKKFN